MKHSKSCALSVSDNYYSLQKQGGRECFGWLSFAACETPPPRPAGGVSRALNFLFLFLFLLPFTLSAQITPSRDTTNKVKVESSVTGEYFLKGDRYVQKLSGNVRLRQDSTLVFCDTAILDQDDAILRGNVLIEQGDSVRVYGDSAHYFGATRQSDIFGNVVLINGRQQLFTSRLHYDLNTKVATYHEGATLTNGKSQLTSSHGYYYTEQKQVFFKGEVLATDPEFTLRTDTMSFNTETQMVQFLAPTLISQQGSRIYCEGGFYDIENNVAEFDKNPQYERDGQRGRSRKMRYNGATKE